MVRLEGRQNTFASKGRKKGFRKSIEFPTGSSVALLGKNGAGKSTLLNIIAGTLDHDGGKLSQMVQSLGQWGSQEVFTKIYLVMKM